MNDMLVCCSGLTKSYGAKPALDHVDLQLAPGKIIGLLGPNGSGKTTLMNLIPRFYDASEGEVLVDGVNVKEYDLEALYAKIGYVSQKAVMFTGTVADNVAFGQNADKSKLTDALEISHSADFISELEDKENAHMARGGTNFSGGQKQRLSIARALCRDCEILIFDDTFSAHCSCATYSEKADVFQ